MADKGYKKISFKDFLSVDLKPGEDELTKLQSKKRKERDMEEGYRVHGLTQDGEKFKSGVHPTKRKAADSHYKMVKATDKRGKKIYKSIEVRKESFMPSDTDHTEYSDKHKSYDSSGKMRVKAGAPKMSKKAAVQRTGNSYTMAKPKTKFSMAQRKTIHRGGDASNYRKEDVGILEQFIDEGLKSPSRKARQAHVADNGKRVPSSNGRGPDPKLPKPKVGDKFIHANFTYTVHKVTPDSVHGTRKNGGTKGVFDHRYVQKQRNESVEQVDETESLDEVLSFAARRKKARDLRKNKAKVKMGRRKAAKRMADLPRLKKRAQKQARNTMFKKLSKGTSRADMSPARRAQIEKRLDKMGGRIERIAKKTLPKVRKMEINRKRGNQKGVSTK